MTRPPLASLLGLAVMAVGAVIDAVVHLALPPDGHGHLHAGFTLTEHSAHAVVVAGMVLTLAGVVVDGARRQLRRRASAPASERSSQDAHR